LNGTWSAADTTPARVVTAMTAAKQVEQKLFI
jgi:hypothetical protein